ncbi:MAG: hypothetical protein ACRC0L_12365 [Angustibacter sp.]
MTKIPDPDLHRVYQQAADWAEFRAEFPERHWSPPEKVKARSLMSRLRVGALITASALAVVVSAVGIPQYLAQRNRASETVSLAGESTVTARPAKKPTESTTIPKASTTPATLAGKSPAPTIKSTAGEAVREVTLVFSRTIPNSRCGESATRTRTVPAGSPIIGTLRRLTQGPTSAEEARGLFSPLKGIEFTTKREAKRVVVDLDKAPLAGLSIDCREKQVGEALTRTLQPLLTRNESLIIRISGSELSYQKYLKPLTKTP